MSLVALAGRWIYRIKINSLICQTREGRVFWIKRRRPAGRWLIPAANAFFRVVRNPVTVIGRTRDWQRWEMESFRLLHGPTSRVRAAGRNGVEMEGIPGDSLCGLLDRGHLTAAMMSAAGLELSHAHRQISPHFEGRWSHGDPHLGNFIFDPVTARCRLIDFEVRHARRMSATDRHLEDLLVPLLDLSSRCVPQKWLPLSLSFLAAYDRPEIISLLPGRLVLPTGPSRLWWAIRTNYCRRALLRDRLRTLREALRQGALTSWASSPEIR